MSLTLKNEMTRPLSYYKKTLIEWLKRGPNADRIAFGNQLLKRFPLYKGKTMMIGGPPGVGKTYLGLEMVVNALMWDESLRVVVGSIEMGRNELFRRIMERISPQVEGVSDFDAGEAVFDEFGERINIVDEVTSEGQLREIVNNFEADVLLVDYLQRWGQAIGGDGSNDNIEKCLNEVAAMRRDGVCSIVLSSLTKASQSTYQPSLPSQFDLCGINEIAHSADDIFVMSKTIEDKSGHQVKLSHVKSRDGAPNNVELWFDGCRKAFGSPKKGGKRNV